MRALLLDIGPVSACCTDHALELMSKSLSGSDGAGEGIWTKHESPFIQSLIEQFTAKGLIQLGNVKAELDEWFAGAHHHPGAAVRPVPEGFAARWTERELALVKLYLISLPPAKYSLADWSLLIDYLMQRYLPLSELKTDAEWLTVKAQMLGKIQANLATVTVAQGAALAARLPSRVADVAAVFPMPPEALDYAVAHACEQVVAMSDTLRHKLKQTVIEHVARRVAGEPDTGLQQQLQDTFATANRDWRRIAMTEAGECANQGFISALAVGAKVKRIEAYNGACAFCKSIDGKVLTVVSPSKPDKDGQTEVWAGKTNVGRSASPRKRVGDELVDRESNERWWIAAGVQHPHCRGIWHRMNEVPSGVDPKFMEWLSKNLAPVA